MANTLWGTTLGRGGGGGGGAANPISLPGIQQVLFVDKTSSVYVANGTIQFPYNTFAAAIAAAAALTPGPANRIGIVCFDAGIYTENITVPRYVSIHAPNATLQPAAAAVTLTVDQDTAVVFHRILQNQGGLAAVAKINTAGMARVSADEIEVTNGTTCIVNLALVTASVLIVDVATLNVAAVGAIGVGDVVNTGHLHLHAEDIYLAANNTTAILRAVAGESTIVRIGHILEDGSPTGTVGFNALSGEIDFIAAKVQADTALTTGALGVLRGFVGEVTGTIVKTGDVRVRYGEDAAIDGIVNPNGIVTGFLGQSYRDTAAGLWYKCDSDPTGTVWSVI